MNRPVGPTELDELLAFVQALAESRASGAELSETAVRGLSVILGSIRGALVNLEQTGPQVDEASMPSDTAALLWGVVKRTDLCLYVQSPAEGGIQAIFIGSADELAKYLEGPDAYCARMTGVTVEDIRRFRDDMRRSMSAPTDP